MAKKMPPKINDGALSTSHPVLNARGTINRQRMAEEVTKLEGGAISLPIGQVAEVIRLACKYFTGFDRNTIMATISEYGWEATPEAGQPNRLSSDETHDEPTQQIEATSNGKVKRATSTQAGKGSKGVTKPLKPTNRKGSKG